MSRSATRPLRLDHDGDVRSDAVQPDELVHPFTLDCCLALQFHAQFDEERGESRILAVDEHRAGPDRPYEMGGVDRAPAGLQSAPCENS